MAHLRAPLVLCGHLLDGDELRPGMVGLDPDAGTILWTHHGSVDEVDADRVEDHGTAWLLPAAVDIHVHMRDPGHPHKEDFRTGTRAALHGGVTCVGDMPNTDPATVTAAAAKAKRERLAPKAHADWFLYGGVTAPGAALRALAHEVRALKIYLGDSTGCVTLEEAERLPEVLDDLEAAGFTGLVAFHAEAQRTLAEAARTHEDAPGLKGHHDRRPPEAERLAFDDIVAAQESFVAKNGHPPAFGLHIAHVSTPDVVQRAPAQGMTTGITTHHVLLHHDLALDARGRMNPPLRSPQMQKALWDAYARGDIPIVESDHAPHTITEKAARVLDAPSGIPGAETLFPLLLAKAAQGELPLARVVATCCHAPAERLGLNKGHIAPGKDADLVVVEPGAIEELRAAGLESRAGWTPYEGHAVLFPRHVWLRGRPAVRDGAIVNEPGSGREVP